MNQQPPYDPRGAARELMYCKAPEILIEGPAGTGKTRAVLEKLYIMAAHKPNVRLLICRKTRASMTESVLVTFESHVVPFGSSVLRSNQKRRTRQAYEFPNGSTIVCGGMDNAERIMSTEYDVIAAFEATELTEDDWEKLQTRLRNNKLPFQQSIADCNPSSPTHWLNKRADRQMQRLLSRHEDNPLLHDGATWTPVGSEYLKKLDALTGPRRERLRYGRWAIAEGVVYSLFDPAIHIINPFPIPKEWRRIRSVDFGGAVPFSCSWWAINGEGEMYRYRQIYYSKRTVQTHAKQITGLTKDEYIEATVCDHDWEDRRTLEEAGIPTIPARKAIFQGIDAVTERLKINPTTGRPRIYFFRDSLVEVDHELIDAGLPVCTEQEFDCYIWPTGRDGRNKDAPPVDKDNHGMDETRYAVMYVDEGGASNRPSVPEPHQVGRLTTKPTIEWSSVTGPNDDYDWDDRWK